MFQKTISHAAKAGIVIKMSISYCPPPAALIHMDLAPPGSMKSALISKDVEIVEGSIRLPGYLAVPEECRGIVLFAHGSGSSRFSPRNLQVAETLNRTALGTLLFDLLTPNESEDRRKVFDIPLLASRLIIATRWIQKQKTLRDLPLGYFGASTGAGAALWAAAKLGHEISAVVSRGGRPDLAIPKLQDVTAPTLLIVGGDDLPVIEMNEDALKYLSHGEMIIVRGATHLFEEPGALEAVSDHAQAWFLRFFTQGYAHRSKMRFA